MANEIGGISQKDYLQKYLPTNNEDKKKKKKFKVLSSSRVKRSQIIDDDIDIKNMQPLDDDDVELYQLDEDAPQIAGIIDERPAEIQAQEYYNDQKRWKVFASGDADGNITVVENEVKKVEEKEGTALKKDGTVVKRRKIQGDGVEKNYEKIIKTTLGLKSKKTALYNDLESSKQGDPSGTKQEKVISSSNKNRSHHNSDISPPRRKPVNSDSDASPPRKSSHRSRRHSDSDLSSPIVSSHKKKESNDSDASPPRKSSHRSRKHSDSDPSPQRVSSHKKKETNDSDVSPPRKSSHRSRKHSDSDLSPPRPSSYKNREDTDVDSRKFFSKSRKDTKPDSSFYKTSHKSRSDSDSDPSPPRKSSTYRHSSPANKNIKTDKKHSHLVGWEKSYKSSSRQRDRNLSPQLDNSKHNNNSKSARDGDRNPSDKKRNKSSPVRKTSKESDTDFSPPRKSQKIRKHSSDSDLTPPRQLSYKKYDSGSHSTKSKYDHKHSWYSRQSDEYDSDTSVKNKSSKRQANSRHQNSRSPKMNDDRQRRDFTQKIIKDKSSKRRKHSDSVSSDDVPSDKKKVQRINERYKETYDDRKEQHNKPKQSQDRSPKQSRDGKMKTTLEGKKAGLQDSSAMKKELVELKNRENQMFAQLKEINEKTKEEMRQQIRLIFRGYRKESEQTKTEMNKKWEETNYKIDLLNETSHNGFKKVNETLDSTPEGTNEKTEIKEDPTTLLHQNKSNKNKEKIKHRETNRRGVQKKQIIKKTKKMHQRKLINTREELEMMKNGLLEMFNLPITDHAEMRNVMECRRTMKEILGGINKNQQIKTSANLSLNGRYPRLKGLTTKQCMTN